MSLIYKSGPSYDGYLEREYQEHEAGDRRPGAVLKALLNTGRYSPQYVDPPNVEGEAVSLTLHDGVREVEADTTVGCDVAWIHPDTSTDGVPRFGLVLLTEAEKAKARDDATEKVLWRACPW